MLLEGLALFIHFIFLFFMYHTSIFLSEIYRMEWLFSDSCLLLKIDRGVTSSFDSPFGL
jgi:hypothetical protein